MSLIEVLVAISILTIGMLAILILFPAGLVSLGVAADETHATDLGQAELEKADASQVQLIGAIYGNDDATADVNPVTFIQSATTQLTATGGVQSNSGGLLTNGTDVDAFRSMQGETVRIPALNSAGNSLYTVVAAPIEVGSLVVSGTPWRGIAGDSTPGVTDYTDPNMDLVAGQPQYLIDYTDGEIALSAEGVATSNGYAEPIVFTVTDANGATTTQMLTVPAPSTTSGAAQPGQWIKLSALNQTSGTSTPGTEPPTPWKIGSDSLVRTFTQINAGTAYSGQGTGYSPSAWTNDPFEYQMFLSDYSPSSPMPPTLAANLGVIAFSPKAAGMNGPDGKPFEAILNYRTFDWHILSEDKLVTSQQGTVSLSLINLLADTAGDVLSDNTTHFSGLFTYAGSGSFTYSGATSPDPDFIVLDMDTGNVLVGSTGATGQSPAPDYQVNYPNGSVSFLGTGVNGTNYVNDHLRIFYHPAKDWAVALARAPIVYSPDPTAASMMPALSTYYIPSTTSTGPPAVTTTTGTTLYFPEVDIGKEVDIRLQYTTTNSTTAATTTTTTEGLYTIVAIGNAAGVNLADATTQSNTIPSSATNITPLSVKGSSMSAIVIWKDNGIWHNRTLSTVLPTLATTSPTNEQ